MVTPDEWLASFEARIADVKEKAAAFQANLETAGASETSPDGALTVTVAPNGALTGLTIDNAAWRGSGEQLAGQIMQLARKAQRSAAANVAEAFAPLAGEDSESLRMVTGYVPPEEDEPEPPADGGRGYAFTNNDGPGEGPTRSGEPPARPSRPPRSSAPDDDEDFGDEQIFRRKDDW